MVLVLGIHPQAWKFLKFEHHLHSPFEKSIVRRRRTIQYVKER
jgi:hypothetical protein